MCLCVDKEKTSKMQKKEGSVTVWKVYEVIEDKLYSPLYAGFSPVPASVDTPVISDRETQAFGKDYLDEWSMYHDHEYVKTCRVYRGIHVCWNRKAARMYMRRLHRNDKHQNDKHQFKKFVIVRCQADMKHLVAVGYSYYCTDKCFDGAVFMGISIGPENFDKALKGDFR